MARHTKPTGWDHAGADSAQPELLDLKATARILGVSARTVLRMSDDGIMPAPVRLRGLVRWRHAQIQRWIDAGCIDLRNGGEV